MAKRVLIVEDEPTARHLYVAILQEEMPEVDVDTAVNGAEAVDMVGSRSYDVILMDLHMPVMDGAEAFRRIRKKCRFFKKMPSVVFCTAFAPPATMDEMLLLDKGKHSLLKKPVLMDQLVTAIRSKLEAQ